MRPEQSWTVRQLFVYKQSGMDMMLDWRQGKGLQSIAQCGTQGAADFNF
jgi:hypothetical protein